MKFTQFLTELPAWQNLNTNLVENSRQFVSGLSDSAKAYAIATQFLTTNQTQVVMVSTMQKATQLASDVANLLAASAESKKDCVELFLAEDDLASQLASQSPELKAARIKAMQALSQKKPVIVIANAAAALRPLPDVTWWQQNQVTIDFDHEYDLEKLVQTLVLLGYQKQTLVAKPGEFSVRGSIIDVFVVGAAHPTRLDFFDTQLDELKQFDETTQRSTKDLTTLTLTPASDMLASPKDIAHHVKKLAAQITKANQPKHEQAKLMRTLTALKTKYSQSGLDETDWLYARHLFGKTTLLDYCEQDIVVVFDELARIRQAIREFNQTANQLVEDYQANLQLPAGFEYALLPLKQYLDNSKPQLLLATLSQGLGRLHLTNTQGIVARFVTQFFGQLPLLKSTMQAWSNEQATIVIMVADEMRRQKILQMLADLKISARKATFATITPATVQVVVGNLSAGFELPACRLVVLSEHELFEKPTHAKTPLSATTFENAAKLRSYTDLTPGDFVVHVNHGIGKFVGIHTMNVGGKKQDYVTLEYQKHAKLYVPITQLDRIQKYVSAADKTPHINQLGNNTWSKTKRKVQSKIEDIADDLIELYAKRRAQSGYAFAPDDAAQHQFEASFAYPETADQLKSAAEIKADMERSQPMDRLLIGDVGFGKTEVALRAAFKAVDNHKQVAFLAPTTVLAQQHFETIKDRFAGFDVNVGLLSRFVSPKQAKQTIKALADGTCQIVVGTHRLLSKDVVFSDLGLLIVDEEQRFGVKHKERLKQLKANVDVLTLTATPIPRTLNMSMLGVRDLSVIETPPANRFPIQTYVLEQNFAVIAKAIEREIKRGGQVFYLHNRVDDIERIVGTLESLLPNIAVGYIHGQMSENQLEAILLDFVAGKFDVLVTTTIIETGVDIPNANTLIVENADKMGLAQLYQLRGRVGRSNRVAYAYFMYQPNKVLSEVGEKRLEAIKDFTELGSGFKIAMRDLAIRGAGNLLGKQQHGFIDSVGYDLYTQMLTDAVKQKQGKVVIPKTNCEVQLDFEAYIPQTYIADTKQKIEIYKRIQVIKDDEAKTKLVDDLIDRFGEPPQSVMNLLEVGRLKTQADGGLIETITQKQTQISVVFSRRASQILLKEKQDLVKLLQRVKLQTIISPTDGKLEIKIIGLTTGVTPPILDDLFALTSASQNYFASYYAKQKSLKSERIK